LIQVKVRVNGYQSSIIRRSTVISCDALWYFSAVDEFHWTHDYKGKKLRLVALDVTSQTVISFDYVRK
jgi:hypothetical protein